MYRLSSGLLRWPFREQPTGTPERLDRLLIELPSVLLVCQQEVWFMYTVTWYSILATWEDVYPSAAALHGLLNSEA